MTEIDNWGEPTDAAKQKDAEIERLKGVLKQRKENFQLAMEIVDSREALIRELTAALEEAIDEYEYSASYKDAYFREKHRDEENIAGLRAVLARAKKEVPT
jgi:arginine decarboxylase-like protein